MPKPRRILQAKSKILHAFGEASKKVYSEKELRSTFGANREAWKLPQSTSSVDFIEFLQEHCNFRKHQFRATAYDRQITRYSWGEPSSLELAQSLKLNGYLCHGTAVALHNLGKQSVNTIYLNVEQSTKHSHVGLMTQEGITRAFSGKQRHSNLTYTAGDTSVTIIAGKNTHQYGVEEFIGPASERLKVTALERTLIDIVVRPAYAGGPSQVIEAYRAAKERLSIDRILTTLQKLQYSYPYHQAIGFIMERAGFSERSWERLRALGLKYDFYIAHGMRQPQYCPEWRLFHPADI